MTINERFFNLLDQSSYTQKSFAEASGISEKRISAWRSRKSDLPASYISTIADLLGVSIDYLVTGTHETKQTFNVDNNKTPSEIAPVETFTKSELSIDEKNLINVYRELDDIGKELLQTAIRNIWADHRQLKDKLSTSLKNDLIG